MSRRLPLGEGEAARTACARGVLRTGVEEKTGEVLSTAALAERVGWAADLVSGMVAALLAEHWNSADVDTPATGEDPAGRSLPSSAWMALRRMGWSAGPPEGIRVNDRIVRIAQEQAGRTLRAAKWRADLTAGALKTWPADPKKRTAGEWDAVREAVPGGQHLPSSVITSRTRQISVSRKKHGRLPADVFVLDSEPRIARMLLLSACDGQQATLERADEPGRALLRLQLPTRPDPRSSPQCPSSCWPLPRRRRAAWWTGRWRICGGAPGSTCPLPSAKKMANWPKAGVIRQVRPTGPHSREAGARTPSCGPRPPGVVLRDGLGVSPGASPAPGTRPRVPSACGSRRC